MPFRRPKTSPVSSQQAIEMKAQSGLFKCINWIFFSPRRKTLQLPVFLGALFFHFLCSSTNSEWLSGLMNTSLALNCNHCHTMNVRTRECVWACANVYSNNKPWVSQMQGRFSSCQMCKCANHTHWANFLFSISIYGLCRGMWNGSLLRVTGAYCWPVSVYIPALPPAWRCCVFR